MSFRCQGCGEAQPPGTLPIRRGLKGRPVEYLGYIEKEVQRVGGLEGLSYVRPTLTSHGTETVLEANLCGGCSLRAPTKPKVVDQEPKVVRFELPPRESTPWHRRKEEEERVIPQAPQHSVFSYY